MDEDYYRPTLRVIALPRLARGQQFVTGGNTVNDARLERDVPGADTIAWSWYDNPFVGTREFNGLRVMMALINNWDLKDINNSATRSGAGDYSIADLGATLGRTGNNLRRSKASSRDYADTIFIDTITPTHVDLRISSRPFFLSVFNFRNYRFRTRMESVGKHIPIADAQWIGERLARLSTMQIGDAFRGAGFAPADVDAYTVVVARRIAALAALGHEGKARLTAFLRMSCSSFHNIGAENPNSSPQVVPCNLKSVDAPSLHCRQSRRDHQTAQGQGGYQIRSAPRTESNEPIGTDDFHTMNQCLNAALVEECGGLPGWASAWPSAGGASRRLTGVGAPE